MNIIKANMIGLECKSNLIILQLQTNIWQFSDFLIHVLYTYQMIFNILPVQ